MFDHNQGDWLPLCKEHHGKGKAVCLDCGEIVVCVFCINREHKSHHIATFTDFGEETRTSFVTLLEEEKPKFSQVEISYKDEVEKIKAFRQEVKKELQVSPYVEEALQGSPYVEKALQSSPYEKNALQESPYIDEALQGSPYVEEALQSSPYVEKAF